METMTMVEYLKSMLCESMGELMELDTKLHALAGESNATEAMNRDIIKWLRLDENQDCVSLDDPELTCILQKNFNGAYDAFVEKCENEEKEHNFEVSFSVSASGRVTVRAKDEYDAQEYVENNIEVEDNGDGVNVYMCDDECVTEDIELDNSSWSLDDVSDEGEVEDD